MVREQRSRFLSHIYPRPGADTTGTHEASQSKELYEADYQTRTKCLILDVSMPAMSGPDIQRELELRGHSLPKIFVTALKDETLRGRLFERGAVACLSEPLTDAALLAALNVALRKNT